MRMLQIGDGHNIPWNIIGDIPCSIDAHCKLISHLKRDSQGNLALDNNGFPIAIIERIFPGLNLQEASFNDGYDLGNTRKWGDPVH